MDVAPASLLPHMMDSSAYMDTVNAPSAAVADSGTVMESRSAAPAALSARVASGELVARAAENTQPDHGGCVPEPVSVVLMTSGLLGLAAARRFRKK